MILPELRIELPTFHAGQNRAYHMPGRFKAIRAGRRWGKTTFGSSVLCMETLGDGKGYPTAWMSPTYKYLTEAYNDILNILQPVVTSKSKIDGVIRTIGNGRVDFWTLDDERAGRSRKYKLVVIDEAAFTKMHMMDTWRKSIMPTLLDYAGSVLVLSNTNGDDPENFFWQICNEETHGFVQYHAPTHDNPHLPKSELERLERETHPLVYKQEYLAEFVDFKGLAFFELANFLEDHHPVMFPSVCDGVFATLDTAVKIGEKNDSTAVIYWAVSRHYGHPLVMLDWEIIQIEGSLLEAWIPTVVSRIDELSIQCRPRFGNIGMWIEDASSGSILIQQGRRKGLKVHAIDSEFTAMGKDHRAISVSSYVHQGKVKISEHAYNKVTTHRGITRNHMLAQFVGYRIGQKDGAGIDDLADAAFSGISIGLGNSIGY
jgi:hypothetical protein